MNIKLDFYLVGGNTVKLKICGRENEGVQMPLQIGMCEGVAAPSRAVPRYIKCRDADNTDSALQ